MKKILLFAWLSLAFTLLNAQIYNPVKWSFSQKQLSENEFELQFKANIEDHWHMYSQVVENEDGPIPTSFTFNENSAVEFMGKVLEPKPITEFDPNFQMDLNYFEHEVVFTQKVKVNQATTITGELEFMVCDASKCLPPELVEFTFSVKPGAAAQPAEVEAESNALVASENLLPPPPPAEESQIYTPVTWEFSSRKDGDSYVLVATATIEDKWHLYSQNLPNNDGPVPTEFTITNAADFTVGAEKFTEIGELHNEYDPNFDMELSFYSNKAVFEQKLTPTANTKVVKGNVYFMTCDDSKCLPPEEITFEVDLETGKDLLANVTLEPTSNSGNLNLAISTIDLENPVAYFSVDGETSQPKEKSGFLTIFFLGFVGGLLALLTPCVFPMIPLTVSFFTKGGTDKKGIVDALTYGFFIFLIYLILSIPFHLMDSLDPEILNTISTNWVLNTAFFVIFVVFAISFFGYFEITLPSKFTNKVDSASNVGGLIGIFFMALTLALVSFSCTGPILGSLLASSLTTDGGAIQLTIGMGGFGLALALPFALFAMFPGWLNSLPKSGGWLNSVKVVLGFLELAMAIKFLSNADLVEHWGILKRELFFGLWIVIGLGLAAYLFGLIKFPHDSPNQKLSKGRIAFGLVVLAFVGYLTPGVTNTEHANLKLLSGFPPPLFYSYYEKDSNCPLGIQCFKDYEEGLAYAKEHNKPIMIDFTGWACVNCRRMEENVWVKPEIYERLNNDYVLISLYVDDRKPLPEDQQFTYTTKAGKTKKIKTVGNKWATLQTETFENNSQPYYALISPDEQLLVNPVGYTPDETEYKQFLDKGLEAYKTLQNQ